MPVYQAQFVRLFIVLCVSSTKESVNNIQCCKARLTPTSVYCNVISIFIVQLCCIYGYHGNHHHNDTTVSPYMEEGIEDTLM